MHFPYRSKQRRIYLSVLSVSAGCQQDKHSGNTKNENILESQQRRIGTKIHCSVWTVILGKVMDVVL